MGRHHIYLSREKYGDLLNNKLAKVINLITVKYDHNAEEMHDSKGVMIEFSGSMNVYKDVVRDLRSIGVK